MRALYERTRCTNAQLAELYRTSAGLKRMATELVANGVETCRLATGERRYGCGTGHVQSNADCLSKPTVEGEYYKITQKVAWYLIKRVEGIRSTPSESKLGAAHN